MRLLAHHHHGPRNLTSKNWSHLHRPGSDPERGFLAMRRAEVTGCKPQVRQALCRWIPLVSSAGSRVSDCHSDRGAHESSGALRGDGPSAGHHTRPNWSETRCAPRARLTVLYLLQSCVFEILLMHLRRNFHQNDRNLMSRMDLKLSKILQNKAVARTALSRLAANCRGGRTRELEHPFAERKTT